ncbi:MAG: hypothetical protein HQL75_01110 [Magnetococcales bacterium]|nr:hypothetical protein [Magnetococcales bacterium]
MVDIDDLKIISLGLEYNGRNHHVFKKIPKTPLTVVKKMNQFANMVDRKAEMENFQTTKHLLCRQLPLGLVYITKSAINPFDRPDGEPVDGTTN